jgi:hypothetical protein
VLTKKVSNVGFESIVIEDRRPIGIDELERYPVFPDELRDLLCQALPEARRAELVRAVTLTARKPAAPEGGTHGA